MTQQIDSFIGVTCTIEQALVFRFLAYLSINERINLHTWFTQHKEAIFGNNFYLFV